LLKSLIEERLTGLNQVQRAAALSEIHPAISTLSKLVDSLRKQRLDSNQVLGKEALNRLVSQIIQIIVEELRDVPEFEEIVDRIANRIEIQIEQGTN